LKWTELALAWQACLEEAWEAYCQGSVPIGAVVANAEGGVVSRGRNRIRAHSAPGGQVCNSQLAHAELNALLGLDSNPPEIHSYAVYTSVEPCPLCMGAIYMSGVRQVYFASQDAYAGSTNLLGTTPYLARKPVRAFGPFLGGLAEFTCALHVDFILRRQQTNRAEPPGSYPAPSGPDGGPVVAAEREVFPLGVALGEKLFDSGLGQQWAQSGMDIATVLAEFQKIAV
jgi:tRNA(adenine34) deaminase